MVGIEVGVDKEATSAHLSSTKTKPLDKAMLRAIQSGGVWTQDRKYRAGMVHTNVCPHCDSGQAEDQEHIWWHCLAWKHIRQQHSDIDISKVHSWPPCMRMCGIVPRGFLAASSTSRQMSST